MSFQIDNYCIMLKLNTLSIIDATTKIQYQKELKPEELILCDNEDDVYELLNEKLTDNLISFELDEDHLVATLKITKTKEIKFNIPKVINEELLPSDISEPKDLIKIIEAQKIQINLLNLLINKTTELENKMNSVLFFELAQVFIRNDVEYLKLGGDGSYSQYLNSGYSGRGQTRQSKKDIIYFDKIECEYSCSIRDGDLPIYPTRQCSDDIILFKLLKNVNINNLNDEEYALKLENFVKYFRHIKTYSNNDLQNLKYCYKLKYLFLVCRPHKIGIEGGYNYFEEKDIKYEELNNLPDTLEFIELNDLKNLTDITFCKKLKKLNGLGIIRCPNIVDISCLKDCPNLEYLDITGSTKIVNLLMLTNPKLKIVK